MQIGFIGLGALGSIMVRNLVAAGQRIHIYNRTQEKLQEFAGKAELHNNLSSIAQACDIILSIEAAMVLKQTCTEPCLIF